MHVNALSDVLLTGVYVLAVEGLMILEWVGADSLVGGKNESTLKGTVKCSEILVDGF